MHQVFLSINKFENFVRGIVSIFDAIFESGESEKKTTWRHYSLWNEPEGIYGGLAKHYFFALFIPVVDREGYIMVLED